jgi:hypothetical protein
VRWHITQKKKDQHGIGQKCPLEIRHLETIAALRKELAQQPRPVQEQSCFCHDGVSLQSVSGGAAPEGYLGKVTLLIDGVLVDYVKAQPEQQAEPVAEVKVKMTGGNVGIATIIHEIYDPFRERLQAGDKLYTTPPQRPWVGLEIEEILDLFDRNNVYGSKWIEFARTVEAKLKERNNGP